MDQIFISELKVKTIVGVYPEERLRPRELLIRLEMCVDLRAAGRSDRVADSVDYATVSHQVKEMVEKSNRYTLEALADDIALLCLKNDRVDGVRVEVKKPGAIPFAESAGVRIERYRE